MTENKCRFCNRILQISFVDLGFSPLSNAMIKKENLNKNEKKFPLHVFVCKQCLLVQLQEFEKPKEIFSDYVYFSSYSKTWLEHSEKYVDMMISRMKLTEKNQVIEIASNDGYLLQFFKEKNIPVLGIEPAINVAKVAQEKNIPTITKFFGTKTAKTLLKEGKLADLLLGNNVLAHVPDLNDFVKGMKIILNKKGVITMEFPHLLQLISNNQFDTIYHEHFSYFSFLTVQKVFEYHGLVIYDVEELLTHGGSLRIFAKHNDDGSKSISNNIEIMKRKEKEFGLDKISTYTNFQRNINRVKINIQDFFIKCSKDGKKVVGYGAPAKGNTLLNYCKINKHQMDFTVDLSKYKQGLFLPGTHIPVYSPEMIKETKPDYVFILPWNLKEEIMSQLEFIRKWNAKFVIPIPEVEIL